MREKACHNMVSGDVKKTTSFEICKQIYTSGLLNKVKLSPSTKLVLIALANHYPNVFPSQKFIATQLGITTRSVERAIFELKNKGLVIYITKKVNNYKFTNLFLNLIEGGKKFGSENLSGNNRKIDGSTSDNLSDKQTNEKTTNPQQSCAFSSKNSERGQNKPSTFNKNPQTPAKLSDYKQRKYHHNTYQEGAKHKTPEQTKKELASSFDLKQGSPLDFSKAQAITYIKNLPEQLQTRSYFAKELKKKWNI